MLELSLTLETVDAVINSFPLDVTGIEVEPIDVESEPTELVDIGLPLYSVVEGK